MKYYIIKDGELYHHGIKGQEWGKRRFQNTDGSLTPAGKERYADDGEGLSPREQKKAAKKLAKAQKEYDKKYEKNYVKAYNETADYANKVLIPKLNAKWEKHKWSDPDDWSKDAKAYEKYLKEESDNFYKALDMRLEELIGKRPE